MPATGHRREARLLALVHGTGSQGFDLTLVHGAGGQGLDLAFVHGASGQGLGARAANAPTGEFAFRQGITLDHIQMQGAGLKVVAFEENLVLVDREMVMQQAESEAIQVAVAFQ
ncbi:hypothetical protein [Pseudomonas baetica]|uniref:hypothetical protein n=1 Tax=Pseudomonas baetica TaxID=674054 RepID=UPI00142E7842|nr:hypothetical protein [Pseudomonas baetica]